MGVLTGMHEHHTPPRPVSPTVFSGLRPEELAPTDLEPVATTGFSIDVRLPGMCPCLVGAVGDGA